MPKVSPQIRSQNAGEWSVLVEGRTDLSKYQSSMRALYNTIVTPQGPTMRRSGTYWHGAVYDETKHSALIPFSFSEEQASVLEFAHLRMRIMSEGGLQTYAPVVVASVTSQVPFRITVPGHATLVGDQVFLTGFPLTTNKANVVANVTAVAGDVLTLSGSYSGATGAVSGSYIARIYHITTPYAEADVRRIRFLQSVDVVYLFCDGYRNFKLSRHGAFDWRIKEVEYKDGPYMPIDESGAKLTLSNTGNPIPIMTSNTTPSGSASSDGSYPNTDPWQAFDGSLTTRWGTGQSQKGTLTYQFPAPVVVDGYVIYLADQNSSDTFTTADFAPSSWKLYGSLTAAGPFVLLDAQVKYLLYDNNRSVWFKINNKTAYLRYQIVITECRRNGNIPATVARWVLSSPNVPDIQITISSITDLNGGEGFKNEDVGRLIRIKDQVDATWRQLKITQRVGATVVNAKLLSEPFADLEAKAQWRLGYFSDHTGWPTCGAFFEDRMAVGGPSGTPDLIAMSRSGAYEDMQQTTSVDAVLDDSAMAFRITSRQLSRIKWLAEDERGLLVGTGAQEFVIVPADERAAVTARNIRKKMSTSRGSPAIEPAKVDRQVIFIQTERRTIREFAYVFETDGYKSPSMSLMASHIGRNHFAQLVYAAEPHSLIWLRSEDGSVQCMTYNREEDVVGWHRHSFGGIVESICAITSPSEHCDVLWVVVQRTINSQTRRYIERLTRFWEFDMTLTEHAHFVDSGLRYIGPPTDKLYGLPHLEGATVDALVDGIKVRGLTVTNGMVNLPIVGLGTQSQIVVGLPYISYGETSRIEAGAAEGTAQGKSKRTHHMMVHLWDSLGGEFGKYHEETKLYEYNPIEYAEDYAELEAPPVLQTDMFVVDTPLGYDMRGSIAYRQEDPYPFNVISIMPQLNTQDR